MASRQETDVADREASQRPLLVGRRGVVPYIATWSEEQELPLVLIERPGIGLGFADETALDRDQDGILWNRTTIRPGKGRPRYAVIHFLRQRRTMRRLLCQVCAQPADCNDDGMLWLLPDMRDAWTGWPDGLHVTEPPVCLPCALLAIRSCPELRKGHVAIRVGHAPLSGVKGFIYQPGRPTPILIRDDLVTYDNPVLLRWTLAEQQLRTLHDCSVVDLDRQPA
jgi:hypothetical protein